MTSNKPKVTLVPIEQRLEDGKPTCKGCPVKYTDYGDWATPSAEMCPFLFSEIDPEDPDCPVHFPTKEAL